MKRNLVVRVIVAMVVLLLSTTAMLAASPARLLAQTGTVDRVGLKLLAEGLTAPIALVPAPDLSGRRFIVDQIGVIWILTSEGKLLGQPFLDLRDRLVQLDPQYDERGLLGLTFHPGFGSNGRLFVYYSVPLRSSAPSDWDHTNRLSEFKVSADDPNRADPASERILLQMNHPYMNHNGGTVAFGSDNMLYLSVGDGGNKNDIGIGHTPKIGNAQDITKLLGKILRFDVDRGDGKGPARDNPFRSKPGRDEIFAYGFRNPYRFSFDMGGSHQLFVGDAGQNLFEEVSIVTKGGNYGWNIKEGTHCFNPQDEEHPPEQCRNTGYRDEPLIDPVIEYGHPEEEEEAATTQQDEPDAEIVGEVVVGGYVYRGEDLPQFAGQYVFGDWSREEDEGDGSLLIAKPNDSGGGLWEVRELEIAGSTDGRLHHFIVGFGQDAAGEMYVLVKDTLGPSGETGKVYKLISAPSTE
jgi:glucose/arabinose dehydrogenase